MSNEPTAALYGEIKRLRELVERQHAELTWMRSICERQRAGDLDTIILPPLVPESSAGGRRQVLPISAADTDDPEAWPSRPVPEGPLHPNPGFLNYSIALSVTKVLGVAVLGLRGAELEKVVDEVQESQRRTQDFIPVFLTDTTETGLFRKRGYVYEYLPAFGVGSGHELTLKEVARRRLNFLQAKWGMAGIITIGGSELYPIGGTDEPDPAGAGIATRAILPERTSG